MVSAAYTQFSFAFIFAQTFRKKETDFGKNEAEILWTERRLKEEKERKEVERGNNESMPNSENLVENSVRGR